MELFVVLIEDRHTDVEAEVFSDREDAIRYARQIYEGRVSPEGADDEDVGERDTADDGWEYSATYSCEGDFVRVEKKTLNAALAAVGE